MYYSKVVRSAEAETESGVGVGRQWRGQISHRNSLDIPEGIASSHV